MISILIPMYCAGNYIEEAIKSVLAQEIGQEIEIIIVDDGSDDDSVSAARKALNGSGDVHAQLLEMPRRGQAYARNTALDMAKGEWIFYLDADDMLTEDALAQLVSAGESSGADIVCARCVDFISPELTAAQAETLKINPEPYVRKLAGCLLIRHELFDRVGRFNEEMRSSETAEWMMRASEMNASVHYIDHVTLRRRYHLNNFGRRCREVQKQSYMEMIKNRIRNNGQTG